jgi:glycerophosphodiester phosphodiesterase
MAQLKAARVADVPTLDVVAPGLVVAEADASAAIAAARGPGGRFSVVGHRGKGMNALASADRRLQEVRENTVRSFNDAARFPVDYVEFDVQVETLSSHHWLLFFFLEHTKKRMREKERRSRLALPLR